jgi:hypothetical protein
MSAGEIALIGAVLRGAPSLPRAACKGLGELFDADTDDDAFDALELCAGCPELLPCRRWAETLKHNKINGVIGGQHRPWVSHKSELARRRPVTLAIATEVASANQERTK